MGQIDGSTHGVWKITPLGERRLQKEWSSRKPEYTFLKETLGSAPPPKERVIMGRTIRLLEPLDALEKDLKEIPNRVKDELLQKLQSVDPNIFEHIVAELVEKLGYGSLADGSIKVIGTCGRWWHRRRVRNG